MVKVFISYSRKDVEFAKQMTVELQKATWISGSTGRASRPPWIGGGKSKKGSKRLDVPDILMEEAIITLP